jgi:hypothetical protein
MVIYTLYIQSMFSKTPPYIYGHIQGWPEPHIYVVPYMRHFVWRNATFNTVIYGACIWFWPTLVVYV